MVDVGTVDVTPVRRKPLAQGIDDVVTTLARMCISMDHFPRESVLFSTSRDNLYLSLTGGFKLGRKSPEYVACAFVWLTYKRLGRPGSVFWLRELTREWGLGQAYVHVIAKSLATWLPLLEPLPLETATSRETATSLLPEPRAVLPRMSVSWDVVVKAIQAGVHERSGKISSQLRNSGRLLGLVTSEDSLTELGKLVVTGQLTRAAVIVVRRFMAPLRDLVAALKPGENVTPSDFAAVAEAAWPQLLTDRSRYITNALSVLEAAGLVVRMGHWREWRKPV